MSVLRYGSRERRFIALFARRNWAGVLIAFTREISDGQLPQSVWFDEGAAHLRINPSSISTDSLLQLTHHVGGCLRPLCVFLLGSAAPAKCDVYQHYRWALEFYFASSNWRGLQPSSKHLTCEREAVELATKALAAALPEAHHQSGGRLQEFVEMAFARRYRSLLVTSGFLDREGQPEIATSPAGRGVKCESIL